MTRIIKADWESEKAIGVDIVIAWCSSVSKRIRVFFPKSLIDEDGYVADWFVNKKFMELDSSLPYGWFCESAPGIENFL